MTERTVDAALVASCGFYCGSCPAYHERDCAGCRQTPGNECFTHQCVTRRGLGLCGECNEFPCKTLLTKEKVTVLDSAWLEWKLRERRERSR